MLNAIFFESDGGWLHRCLFAGVDGGMPQWVKIDQGETSQTLEDFKYDNCIGDSEFRLLCVEGEAIASLTLAKMLGATLQVLGEAGYCLHERLKTLESLGAFWEYDPLEIRVVVNKAANGMFCFRIDTDGQYADQIAELCESSDLTVLFSIVRHYLTVLKHEAEIPVTATLKTSEWLLEQMNEEDKQMFEKIED